MRGQAPLSYCLTTGDRHRFAEPVPSVPWSQSAIYADSLSLLVSTVDINAKGSVRLFVVQYRAEHNRTTRCRTYLPRTEPVSTAANSAGLDRESRLCYSESGYESPRTGVSIQEQWRFRMLAPAHQSVETSRTDSNRSACGEVGSSKE